MYVSVLLRLEDAVSLVSSTPPGFSNLIASSSVWIPEPGMEGFEKPIGSLPEMEALPDAANVAKNMRRDRLWAPEERTTILLLKEYSSE